MDYSFSKLSEKARRHLPFLGLFSERVDAHRIHYFTGHPSNQILVQTYRGVFGENLQKADWLEILNEAAEAGIVEYLNITVYKIHPTLPWYLRQRLSQHHEAQQISELEKKLLAFYAQLAQDYGRYLISPDYAQLGRIVLDIEEPNLLKNLRFAEQQQKWLHAQGIMEVLQEVYRRFGRAFEFELLRQQALMQIGTNLTQVKVKGESAFNFWIFLQLAYSGNSNEIDKSLDLEELTVIYQKILDELTAFNDSSVDKTIAMLFHKMGLVTQEQGKYEPARDYYLKALKIIEDTEDLYDINTVYLQLGNVAWLQEQYEQARDYYLKALKVEELGDLYAAGHVYHQLGNVAYIQYQYEQALTYYSKVLKIRLDMGDWHNAAKVYHQLGKVVQELGQYKQAYDHYMKALKIKEDEGDMCSVANTYVQLGTLAHDQQQFEEAINYQQKAFKIFMNFRDWDKASLSLNYLGKVLETQENYVEALKIYINASLVRQQIVGSDIDDFARMLRQLAETQFNIIWREVTGEECEGEIREAIWSARKTLEIN